MQRSWSLDSSKRFGTRCEHPQRPREGLQANAPSSPNPNSYLSVTPASRFHRWSYLLSIERSSPATPPHSSSIPCSFSPAHCSTATRRLRLTVPPHSHIHCASSPSPHCCPPRTHSPQTTHSTHFRCARARGRTPSDGNTAECTKTGLFLTSHSLAHNSS